MSFHPIPTPNSLNHPPSEAIYALNPGVLISMSYLSRRYSSLGMGRPLSSLKISALILVTVMTGIGPG